MARRKRRRLVNTSRRKFLRQCAKAAAGVALTSPALAALFGVRRFDDDRASVVLPGDRRAPQTLPKLGIARAKLSESGPNRGKPAFFAGKAGDERDERDLVRRLTDAAIFAIGGMGAFVERQDTVLIKPNMGWALLPQYAATTNPFLVERLAELCLDAGARRVIVTDHTCHHPREVFTWSGIERALKNLDGACELRMQREDRYRRLEFGLQGSPNYRPKLPAWLVGLDYLEVDKVINVPIAKHHTHTLYTGAMKNCYGFLGNPREKLHQMKNESIAEMSAFMGLKAGMVLNVLDGYRILKWGGPTGGSLRYVGERYTVIAGADPVAVDACGVEMLYDFRSYRGRRGLRRVDIPYLAMGRELGLGNPDWDRLDTREAWV